MAKAAKTIKVEQIGSAIRRHHSQRETLIGPQAQQDRPDHRTAGHA